MKRILLAITMLALVLPTMRQAEAGVDVSIDFFYDNLDSEGSWVEVADYGYCWQPGIAVSNSNWRPYTDGYWVYTDVGWTWVSNEDFGWAAYHYGRWVRLRDRGWFWVPGREWGPAWVSWRTGGDYVGWAPLPPRHGGEVDFEGRSISGQVDVELDIGPAYYNFIEVRYIGEPVLRERIFEPSRNVTCISTTVNVTRITYTNSVVYNYGPDYDALSRYSVRPIRRMTLEREANIDRSVAVKSNALLRVQGDKLVVAAPPLLQKPAKSVAPKVLKEKIEKPAVERGWDGVPDPKAKAELKEMMRKEDPKAVATPSFTPNTRVAPAGSAAPATAASPAVPAAPGKSSSPALLDKDKGKDKRLEKLSPVPIAPAPPPASSPDTTTPGKHKGEREEKAAPSFSPPSASVPGTSPVPTRNKRGDRPQNSPTSLITSPDGTPFRETPTRDKEIKKAPDTMPPIRQPSDGLSEKAPRKPKDEFTPAPPNPEAPAHSQPKRSLPPERVAPPSRETPADSQPKRPLPPERVAPPSREAPPDAPRKHPLPPEQAAPPPGPGANVPAQTEVTRSHRGPNKKTTQPAPSPGP